MLCNHFALMTILCISVNFFSFSRNFSFLVMLHCVFWLISHCVLISVLSFFFFNQFECTYYKIYFNFIFLVKFVKYYHFGRGWIHRYSVKRKPCVSFSFSFFSKPPLLLFFPKQYTLILFMIPQTQFSAIFFIKNWSHDTIHIFKNYFLQYFQFSTKISYIKTEP